LLPLCTVYIGLCVAAPSTEVYCLAHHPHTLVMSLVFPFQPLHFIVVLMVRLCLTDALGHHVHRDTVLQHQFLYSAG